MKKTAALLGIICLSMVYLPCALAGGIDNKHNWSTEYIRTLNRNAATDSADATVYNPAGVMKLDDGMYLNFSIQDIEKEYTNQTDGTNRRTDEPSYVPSLFALYKGERMAGYFAFTVPAGGGDVHYKEGSATTNEAGLAIIGQANATLAASALAPFLTPDNYYSEIDFQEVEATSFYKGYTFGGSFKINDMVSVSLGARYIDAYKEAEASLEVSADTLFINPFPPPAIPNADLEARFEYSQEATGWGGIIGINVSPNEQVNIGLRYETRTRLTFEYDVEEDSFDGGDGLLEQQGIEDGDRRRRDLPALLGFGVGYQFTENWKVDITATYYFHESADWEDAEDEVSNGIDAGLSLEYAFSDQFRISMGYLRTATGIQADEMLNENPELDADTFSAGFVYEATEMVTINFGIAKVFYHDDEYTSALTGSQIKFEKDVIMAAFGIQVKF